MTYVMYNSQPKKASVIEAAPPISPTQPRNDRRQEQAEEEGKCEEPVMLPCHNGILFEVADICGAVTVARLDEHPANMGPQKSMLCTVRVEVGIGVAMMCSVMSCPPFDGSLNGA